MQRVVLITLLATSTIPTQPSRAARAPMAQARTSAPAKLVRRASQIIKTNLWCRDTVDWGEIERELQPAVEAARADSDAYAIIRRALRLAHDRHSFLVTPDNVKELEEARDASKPPEVDVSSDGVGMVTLDAYLRTDAVGMQQYYLTASNRLSRAAKSARCGWIIDLRTNRGGNMWPMIAALRPFLGDEVLGAFRDQNGLTTWRAGSNMPWVPSMSLNFQKEAVAVLIGPSTGSSGEGVAVAFRGRPRTRFFGNATAGVSTATRSFVLTNRVTLVLAVAEMVDRTGRRYGGVIEPDETVVDTTGRGEERVVAAARAWLKAEVGCGSVSSISATWPRAFVRTGSSQHEAKSTVDKSDRLGSSLNCDTDVAGWYAKKSELLER